MDPLAAHAEVLGDPLESPAFFPQPGDGGMLLAMDLGVRMGMFEQELTPVVPAGSQRRGLREQPSTLLRWSTRCLRAAVHIVLGSWDLQTWAVPRCAFVPG